MSTTTYSVTGMTCEHCVAAVTREVRKIDGVSAVEIELVSGGASHVTIVSAAAVTQQAVRAAVDEAGFELSGASV
jgi:copper chaperone